MTLQSGNTSDFRVSKFMALLLQAFAVVMILIVQSTSTPDWLDKVPGIRDCGSDKACYSLQIAYRISFATACVFAFHLALSLLGRCVANKALNSFWIFKFFFVIGGSALFLLIPNGFFTVWGDIADVVLAWFLVIQMVVIIDFAFSWNDLWITNAAEDRAAGKTGKAWFAGILFSALAALIGAYTWYGLMFRDYADENDNRTIMGINVGISTALGVVSVFSPRGGILPASLVILYIAWLSWSTVLSGEGNVTTDARLGVGITMAGLLLIYSSAKANLPQVASNTKESIAAADPDPVDTAAYPPGQLTMVEAGHAAPASPAAATPAPGKKHADAEVGSCRYILFLNSMHLSAACYLMNLCLLWSNSPRGSDNMIAYWVQAAAAWLMLTVYAWTLVAPLACPNRQF